VSASRTDKGGITRERFGLSKKVVHKRPHHVGEYVSLATAIHAFHAIADLIDGDYFTELHARQIPKHPLRSGVKSNSPIRQQFHSRAPSSLGRGLSACQ